MRKFPSLFAALFAFAVAWVPALPARAAAPELLSYQGVLLENGSVAVTDGIYQLKFELFPQLVAGSAVFSQTLDASVKSGLYNVILSNNGPYNLATILKDNSTLYMEVSVGGVPMQPRQQLASVPYAISAGASGGSSGACYTHWGKQQCSAAGFETVLSGRLGGLESYGTGVPRADPSCISDAATAITPFPTHFNRFFRSDAEGDGGDILSPDCAICCSGGCYTAFGTDSCKAGYSPVYTGRVGGTEAYLGFQSAGTMVCIDDDPSLNRHTLQTGLTTRLFRFRAQPAANVAGGADHVDGLCVQCCKTN